MQEPTADEGSCLHLAEAPREQTPESFGEASGAADD